MPGFYIVGPIQFYFAVLLSLFLLFSCAPGKDDTEGEDRSTPYVASISPDNAATGVPTSKTITITFSKAIPPSQVTVDTDWQCSKNIQIAFDSSYSSCLPLTSNGGDNASKVFILTPNTKGEKIPSGTKFWIKISSSIKDYYDKEMDADKTSSFTTETRCSSGCSWSQVTTVGDLTARSGHSGLVFNKKMRLFGGTTGSSYLQDSFNTDNGTWVKDNITTTMWSGRENHVSLRFKGKMWVIGGGNSTSSYGDVWSSSTGLAWNEHTLTNGFSARQGHAGVVFKNKMWVFGGYFINPAGSDNFLNDVYSSEDGLTWVKEDNVTTMWSERYGHSAVVYDDKIWVMGGNNSNGDSKEVWYSSDGISWTQQTSSIVTWDAMKDFGAQVFDGKIWILGGNPRTNIFYTFDGTTWSDGQDASWSVRSSLVSFRFDNYLWVVGGDNGTGGSTHMNDVWKYGKP